MTELTWIWTDGSYAPNTNVGAWAWVRGVRDVDGQHAFQVDDWKAGAVTHPFSSERMEAWAIREAIRAHEGPLMIVTDLEHLARILGGHSTSLKLWVSGVRRKKNPALDVLQDIEKDLQGRDVKFQHVKGHSGDMMNRIADRKAFDARRRLEKQLANQPPSHIEALGGWSDWH